MNQIFYPNGTVDEVLQLIAGPKFPTLVATMDYLQAMYDPDVSIKSNDVDGLWVENCAGSVICVIKWDGKDS